MESIMNSTIKKRLSILEDELSITKKILENQGASESLVVELQKIIEVEIIFLYLLLNE
jgi:hypothetical protein